MTLWTLICRRINGFRKRKGAAYAAKMYDLLSEQVQKAVTADLRAYHNVLNQSEIEKDPKSCLKTCIVKSSIFRTLYYIRCKNCSPEIPRLQTLLDTCRFFLPPNDRLEINTGNIGGGLRIFHAPVLIGEEALIGENVTLNFGVVIGKRHRLSPVIHDNVMINAGAMVLGGIEVGENAIIGAGSLVITDVPPNSVYAGSPAKLLHPVTGKEIAERQERTLAKR